MIIFGQHPVKDLLSDSSIRVKRVYVKNKNILDDLVKINKSGEDFGSVDVWLGKKDFVKVYTKEDIYKIIKKGKKKLLKVKMLYEGPVEAPISKDQVLAKLRIIYDDELIDEYDLLAKEQVNKVNIFSRLMKSLNYLIWGDV